jgi:hypothetical protein
MKNEQIFRKEIWAHFFHQSGEKNRGVERSSRSTAPIPQARLRRACGISGARQRHTIHTYRNKAPKVLYFRYNPGRMSEQRFCFAKS